MENKKDILSRTYLVYMFLCLFALAILYKICVIQFMEGDEWKRKAEAFNTRVFEIEAVRGNIFDVNGNLLATSLPYYEVAVDINAPSIDKKLFNEKVDSLSDMLADLFKDKTGKEYKKILKKARNSGDRYVVLKRNVSYKNLQILKTFPIFKKGKRGGLVTLQTNKRELPFKMLAARTIGMSRPGVRPVGLEGAFDSTLMGISGQRLMQKIAGDVWRPINDENEVEPKNGNDLITTIDINIQDVAETALEKTLRKNNATHGCAILMEVKTGEIKAIANLTRTGKDSSNYAYSENLNYAVLNATEPGSTFKLVSLMAIMDEYNASLDEKMQVGNGEVTYYNKTIKDSHAPTEAILSMQRIFETSSNVGVAKLVMKYFSKNPQQYVDRIKSYHLNQKLGLSIPGEAAPLIKNTKSSDWSGVTLPQMSYGYETLLTPLQILAFYNAVANDGRMVKPRFEKAIINNGKTVKTYTTEVLAEQIAKPETIKKAKIMMEGVVQNGSGKGLNITAFKVGGKTGTAQIAQIGNRESGTTVYGAPGNRKYQASFVGYFPADNPLYSCIVVVYNPGKGTYYGGLIAGPVFKEIAEKVYSSSLDFMQPINTKQDILTKAPASIKSKNNEMLAVSKALKLPVKTDASDEAYVARNTSDSSKVVLQGTNLESQLKKGIVPNLNGLSAKDALFLLENSGFHVKLMGIGSVKKQSIEAGQKFNKGDKIVLTLS